MLFKRNPGLFILKKLEVKNLILSDPVQISQIRHGKSPSSQPALIVSDPVQISQIRHGKSPLSQPALIVSDLVQISQIRHGKSTLSRPFSVTNLGSPDRV